MRLTDAENANESGIEIVASPPGKKLQNILLLSGGEKNKLVLAQLTYLRPNLLILDEPTNHLDLDSRQALGEMLVHYEGTLLLISHVGSGQRYVNTPGDSLEGVHSTMQVAPALDPEPVVDSAGRS